MEINFHPTQTDWSEDEVDTRSARAQVFATTVRLPVSLSPFQNRPLHHLRAGETRLQPLLAAASLLSSSPSFFPLQLYQLVQVLGKRRLAKKNVSSERLPDAPRLRV